MRLLLPAALAGLLCLLSVTPASALEDVPSPEALHSQFLSQIRPLLNTYCMDCHDADMTSKSTVRLDNINPEILANNIDTWTRVKNMLDVGSMPPKGKQRPTAGELDQLLNWIGGSLRRYDAIHLETGGNTLIRRLNNRAYANIIKTLLDIPAQGVEDFPEDGTVRGYDTVGSGLYATTYLYDLYLQCAQRTLDLAISDQDKPPPVQDHVHRYMPPPGQVFDYIRKDIQGTIADLRHDPRKFARDDLRIIGGDLAFRINTLPAPLESLVRKSLVADVIAAHYGGRSMEELAATGSDWTADPSCVADMVSALEWQIEQLRTLEHYASQFRAIAVAFNDNYVGALEPGYYEVSATLCALNAKYPLPVAIRAGNQVIDSFMVDAPAEAPRTYKKIVFNNHAWSAVNALSLLPYNGEMNNPRRGFAIGFMLNHMTALYGLTGQQYSQAASAVGLQTQYWEHVPGDDTPQAIADRPAAILCSQTNVRGPIHDVWPPPATTRIFTRGLKEPPSREYAREIVETFMKRAYVIGSCDEALSKPYVDLIMSYYATEKNFVNAVKFGLAGVLSSPQFLYLEETQRTQSDQGRPLGAFELARRLAYFLWSDLPDDELMASAASGKLLDAAELRAQTRRMLKDGRSKAFREAFTCQWLKLDKLDKIAFSYDLYPAFDTFLLDSARQESVAYFSELLDKNLSILDFIDSDFVMINGRLALHYGIPGVAGNEIRRVTLPPGSHRGGVLEQASVLMATSNGMVSSLVRRGAFMMERLLGVSPGVPPPNVPALDKVDKVGADQTPLTPRERLALHRANQSCARCHDRIDPLGAGLENYDALGCWSAKIRVLLPELSKKTQSMWLERDGDVSGQLLDGTPFRSPEELKARLLEHKDQFTRTLAENLMIYALGRDLQLSDRPVLDKLCADVAAGGYGLSTLVECLVLSDAFTQK